MRLAIQHLTHYRFARPVAHGLQRLRLTPKSTSGQQVIAWTMRFTGALRETEFEDQNHNLITLASVVPGATEVVIACDGVVDTADTAGVIGNHSGFLPLWHFLEQTPLTRPGGGIRSLVQQLAPAAGEPLPALHLLSEAVRTRVAYQTGYTDADSTAEDALAARRGVCQDHAHVFISAARAMGLPARYVSGYLMMDDRVEQEAGHGWAEAHVDGLGWVGFDVSNGISPDSRYVRVATGRDYREAAPVTGISYGSGEMELRVSLAVEQRIGAQ